MTWSFFSRLSMDIWTALNFWLVLTSVFQEECAQGSIFRRCSHLTAYAYNSGLSRILRSGCEAAAADVDFFGVSLSFLRRTMKRYLHGVILVFPSLFMPLVVNFHGPFHLYVILYVNYDSFCILIFVFQTIHIDVFLLLYIIIYLYILCLYFFFYVIFM